MIVSWIKYIAHICLRTGADLDINFIQGIITIKNLYKIRLFKKKLKGGIIANP